MDKTNILFLIIGFLAGFGVAMPLWVYFGKKTVLLIARQIGAVALKQICDPTMKQAEILNATARAEFSTIGAGINQSAADTFQYLSKLITPESIETAYELDEPPVGCSLNLPNRTRALAADLVKRHTDKQSAVGHCAACGIFSEINYFSNEKGQAICGHCKDKLDVITQARESVAKPSDAPDTFNLRLSAIDRVNKDIFDGEIVSGDEFSMNLVAFDDVTRVGIFKAGIDYAIARAVFDNRRTEGFRFGNDFAGILTCYIVYELDAVFPKVKFAYLPSGEIFADNIIEQIGAHLARELNTSGVLESFKTDGGAK